jgi:hypothetical protein
MNPSNGPATAKPGRALGVLIPTLAVFLVAGFFAAHQLWSTGFFLPEFGTTIAALFYASILYTIAIVIAGVYTEKDSRTVIVVSFAGAILWTVTTVWLWIVFPFDFTHLPDVVPAPLQFLLTWITPGIGKMLWALLAVGSAAFIPFYILQFATRRRRQNRLTA